jgi:AcrR family transcriptional regulator
MAGASGDSAGTAQRAPLSRERVLATAMQLVDDAGLEALTMRPLAEILGVEVMSLYHHVPNKAAIVEGIIDLVFEELGAALDDAPTAATPATWTAVLRARILGARAVMLRHPWAPPLIETRTTVSLPQALYVDSVIGIMRAGGLSFDLIHHSMHALGSRAYGFVQEVGESSADDAQDAAQFEQMAALVPNLVGMLAEVAHDEPGATLGWCDDQTEFEFGLDLLLEGIERRRS